MTSSKDSNLEIQMQQIENILDVLKQQLQGIKKYQKNVPVMELEMLQHNVNTLSKSVADLPVEKQEEVKKTAKEISVSKNMDKEPEHSNEDLMSEIGVIVNENKKSDSPNVKSKSFVEKPIDAKVSALSIHERIAEKQEDNSHANHHQTKKLDSLKSTIGLNEKFLFITDLFHGKNDLYDQAVKKLDACNELDEAMDVINHHLPSDIDKDESITYKQFVNLLNRRYEA